MILVIAGTHAEFQHFVRMTRTHGASDAELAAMHYVGRENDLRGYRNVVVVFTGQWWKNPAQALAHDLVAAGVLKRNLEPSALFSARGDNATTIYSD